MRNRWERPPARRGFVLAAMIASMAVVLSIAGLAIDSGHLQLAKLRMQTAADAAALGAVDELRASGNAHVTDAARADAASNGFSNGRNSTTVAVNSPPSSGDYTSDPTAVEVVIRQTVNTFFMGLVGFPHIDVTARAVARRGPGTNCIYVLDGAASGALTVTGTADSTVSCGIMIDSTSASGVILSGNAVLRARAVSVVGNCMVGNRAVLAPGCTPHVMPEADPLAYVPAPSFGGCDHPSTYSISGGAVTLSPGVYCGGIAISGASTRVRFNAGTYVLKGPLSVSSQATLTGSGVTFYLTSGSGYGYGGVSLSGQATLQLSAPVSGPLAGILFFQDRAIASGVDSTVSGGSGSFLTGALYFPGSALGYAGGSATDYTIIVAKRVTLAGNTFLNSDYSTLESGTPIKGDASLSE